MTPSAAIAVAAVWAWCLLMVMLWAVWRAYPPKPRDAAAEALQHQIRENQRLHRPVSHLRAALKDYRHSQLRAAR